VLWAAVDAVATTCAAAAIHAGGAPALPADYSFVAPVAPLLMNARAFDVPAASAAAVAASEAEGANGGGGGGESPTPSARHHRGDTTAIALEPQPAALLAANADEAGRRHLLPGDAVVSAPLATGRSLTVAAATAVYTGRLASAWRWVANLTASAGGRAITATAGVGERPASAPAWVASLPATGDTPLPLLAALLEYAPRRTEGAAANDISDLLTLCTGGATDGEGTRKLPRPLRQVRGGAATPVLVAARLMATSLLPAHEQAGLAATTLLRDGGPLALAVATVASGPGAGTDYDAALRSVIPLVTTGLYPRIRGAAHMPLRHVASNSACPRDIIAQRHPPTGGGGGLASHVVRGVAATERDAFFDAGVPREAVLRTEVLRNVEATVEAADRLAAVLAVAATEGRQPTQADAGEAPEWDLTAWDMYLALEGGGRDASVRSGATPVDGAMAALARLTALWPSLGTRVVATHDATTDTEFVLVHDATPRRGGAWRVLRCGRGGGGGGAGGPPPAPPGCRGAAVTAKAGRPAGLDPVPARQAPPAGPRPPPPPPPPLPLHRLSAPTACSRVTSRWWWYTA